MQKLIGFGFLSMILVFAGYPFIYRTYLNVVGKIVYGQMDDIQARTVFAGCFVVTISQFSSKDDIESCSTFFTNYLPEKTKSLTSNSAWPIADSKERVREVYIGLNKVRVVNSLLPLPPLEKLSNGHLHGNS